MRLTDGSGLSPANRASAAAVSDLLLAMRDQRGFPLFLDGLAVAGRSGTLAARMRGTSATGRVRAKTGSLFDTPTSTLAGYVWPAGLGMRADRALIVVILSNGIHPERARPRQDTIMEALTAPGAVESSSPAATPRSPGAGTPSPIAGPG
jgi:D-alanyl-D-alanine carboxypeptidase/D-alanyl-D-alanine-endopeptidase (penicillin-binding protein 4)